MLEIKNFAIHYKSTIYYKYNLLRKFTFEWTQKQNEIHVTITQL